MSWMRGLFYCVWDKPRAGRQQRQLHRADRRNQTGVVDLIRFMRRYTEPLASRAGPAERTKLFLISQPHMESDRVAEYDMRR